jgi:hypothetical protein
MKIEQMFLRGGARVSSPLLALQAFSQQFEKEEDCVHALFQARWPDGFRCPRCSHPHAYTIHSRRLPLYECLACHYQTSLIAGTVMAGSRTSLRTWFQAIYLHSLPEGLSAYRLHLLTGITYKCAWLICHKLRHAMSCQNEREQLKGYVRINSAVYADQPRNFTFTRMPKQHTVLVGASLDDSDEPTHVKIKLAPNKEWYMRSAQPKDLNGFTQRFVDNKATTEVIGVPGMVNKHRCPKLRNLVDNCWRWVWWTFRGIALKHLQAYLNQFTYEWNHSRGKDSSFNSLLGDSIAASLITYKQLKARDPGGNDRFVLAA